MTVIYQDLKPFNCLPSRLGLYNTPTAYLQRGKPPPANECPRYDTKKSDVEFPIMRVLWGMRSTPSLPSLPVPLWPRFVTTNRVLSIGQIELNSLLMLNRIA